MRNSDAFLDKYDSTIAKRQLYHVGKNWTRNVFRKDSTGKWIKGLLTEHAATNLITESVDLTAWTANNVTIDANANTSPDLESNADTIQEDGTTDVHSISLVDEVASSANDDYVFAALLKKTANRTVAALGVTRGAGTSPLVYFDLDAGTVGTEANVTDSGMQDWGDDYYLCYITWLDAGSTTLTPTIYACDADGSNSYAGGTQDSIIATEAILELGRHPSSGIRTDGATVIRWADHPLYYKANDGNIDSLTGSGAEGAIECDVLLPPNAHDSGHQLVRLSDAGCNYDDIKLWIDAAGRPRLKLDKDAPIYSLNDFSGVVTEGITITANSATDPDGGSAANLLSEDGATSAHYFYFSIPSPKYGVTEQSCFFKMINRRYVSIAIYQSGAKSDRVVLDLLNGEAIATVSTSPARIVDYGVNKLADGWARLWIRSEKRAAIGIVYALSDALEITYAGASQDDFYFYMHSTSVKRTNLLSLDNDITGYTLVNCTVTANNAVDPMGTSLADTIVEDGTAAAAHYCYSANDYYTIVGDVKYKVSGFFKAENRSWILFGLYKSATNGARYYFDLTNQTYGTISSSSGTTIYDVSVEDYGSDWCKCSIVFSFSQTEASSFISLYVAEGNGDITFDGVDTQEAIHVSEIRLEPYQTEIEVIAEPTNLLDNSYSFSSPYWTKTRSSISGHKQLDPFGTYTAEILHEDATASSTHYVGKTLVRSLSIGDKFVFYVFAKQINNPYFALVGLSAGSHVNTGYFDLANGVLGSATSGILDRDIIPCGNGWYLCWIYYIQDVSGTSLYNQIHIAESTSSYTFSGADQDSLYICNPVLETGVTAPTRFNACDGKIHRIGANWKNGFASVSLDSQKTGRPSTVIDTTFIPVGLDRIDIGPTHGVISNISLSPSSEARK